MKERLKKLKDSKLVSIIMLMLFFPVGLVLLWLNKGFKKRSKIILTLITVFIIIPISTMTEVTPTPETTTETVTEVKVENKVEDKVEEPAKPQLSEEEKREQAKQYERATFRSNFEELDNAEFELFDNGHINVNFDLSDNLTNKLTVAGYYLDLKNTCEELKKNSHLSNYQTITFTAFTDFVNSYGETFRGKAISATIKVSDINRIQFDKITNDQFKMNVETEYIHPALTK